jgi:hypothetical protein
VRGGERERITRPRYSSRRGSFDKSATTSSTVADGDTVFRFDLIPDRRAVAAGGGRVAASDRFFFPSGSVAFGPAGARDARPFAVASRWPGFVGGMASSRRRLGPVRTFHYSTG